MTCPLNTKFAPNRKQHGAALMVMLVIMVMGAATILVSSLSSSGLRIERDKITADALAQAKAALIGYSTVYPDTHLKGSPERIVFVPGHLPCPDASSTIGNEGDEDPDRKSVV